MMNQKYSKLTHEPLVSVILPVYNCDKYLASAIDSILGQSYPNLELILVDGCSTDKSLQICEEYAEKDSRIILIKNQQKTGLCESLNQAIELSRGVYIARMDADDISSIDRIEQQVKVLENDSRIAIVGCAINIIDSLGKVVGSRDYYRDDESIREHIFFFSPFCHPAIMMRKWMLVASGSYDVSHAVSEDYDLYFRIGMHGLFYNLKKTLFSYRIVSSSATHTKQKMIELKTIEIRDKYKSTSQYRMGYGANLFQIAHKLSMVIIPSTVKYRLFKLIRDKKLT